MSKDEKKEALTLRESHRVEEVGGREDTSPRRSYPAGMFRVSRRRAGAAAVYAASGRGPGPGTDLRKKRVRLKPKHPSLKEE